MIGSYMDVLISVFSTVLFESMSFPTTMKMARASERAEWKARNLHPTAPSLLHPIGDNTDSNRELLACERHLAHVCKSSLL